jgi:phosphatidylinositol alpha-mannosyltransferase
MKIGLVFDASLDKADGVAQYVLTLGRWFGAQGHTVHYLVGETERTDLPNLHSLSRNLTVRVNQNRVRTPLPASKKIIRQLLAKEQFDVLHVQMPYSPWLAGRVIKAAGPHTAVIGTFHIMPASWLVSIGTRCLGWFLHRNLKRFDATLSVSTAAQRFSHQAFDIASQVVPNTAPFEHFYHAKPFMEYKDVQTVVFLGRLVERKGCQHLLAAVAKLNRDGTWPDKTKVVVCGSGPLELKLTAFVHEQGLTEIVEFKGFISEADKPRYLASADVAIFPSTGGESFGIVLIEAMAASRGVVLAGHNPGYASVMHAHPESLFDPNNTAALAELLAKTLHDPKARERARAWQQDYAHEFDPGVVGQKVLDVYKAALRKKSK